MSKRNAIGEYRQFLIQTRDEITKLISSWRSTDTSPDAVLSAWNTLIGHCNTEGDRLHAAAMAATSEPKLIRRAGRALDKFINTFRVERDKAIAGKGVSPGECTLDALNNPARRKLTECIYEIRMVEGAATKQARKTSRKAVSPRTEPTRKQAIAIAKKNLGLSYTEIGREMGGISKQAAHDLVKDGEAILRRRSKSVKTQRLPQDARGQIDPGLASRRQPRQP